MIKVGLLGAGRIATVHATTISNRPLSNLAAVADINNTAALKIADRYGCEVKEIEEILK